MTRAAAFLLFACIACVHREQHQLDVVHLAQDVSGGTLAIHSDAEQYAALDQHTIDTAGPVEQLREVLGPDGGVAERVTTRWAGSTQEAWLRQQSSAEEHVDVDAGTFTALQEHGEAHEKGSTDTHPAASCAFGGGLWTGLLVVGVAGFLWLRRNWLRVLIPRLAGAAPPPDEPPAP